MSVITLLTVQNTQSVARVQVLDPSLVAAQLEAVLADIPPRAAKTGALGSAEVVVTLARLAGQLRCPLVVDPVMISKHGTRLIDGVAARTLAEQLLPHAFLVTPNLHEAAALSGIAVHDLPSMERAAEIISQLGVPNVLVKGGHLEGQAVDLLWEEGTIHTFAAERVPTQHTHGSGCVYSAAITARLAFGEPLPTATRLAKRFVTRAIQNSPQLGKGYGPLNLFAKAP
jgi:hydroxymethylpyrimidine/phosphomethylpyrimidine kinase